jgi:hypothetical protein
MGNFVGAILVIAQLQERPEGQYKIRPYFYHGLRQG